jgi:transposase-like protein
MKCKFCGSESVIKVGKYYQGGIKQRYLCKNCGRIFVVKIAPPPEQK